MESDDHDFNEINSINLLNDANDLITLFYKADIEEEETKNSVGSIVLDDSINQLFSNLESELRNSEFKTSLIDKLRKYYSPGKKIKRSFFELLFDIFDKHGLIIFDPQNDKIKNLLKPIFIKELNDFREHTKKLVSVSAELEGKYHAQVKIKPINLFYNLDNGRYSIEPDENIFKLRRKRKQFSFDELISEVENHPEKFSPNVLLRPITQEYLFNTAFYVAGPSEIAYFAQINPLYEFFNLIPPIIYPRASTTLLEKHLMNFIEKYDLEIKDIFYGQEHLKEKIFSRISELDLNAIFDANIEKINQIFDQLKQELFRVDKTLSDSVNKYRDRNVLLINELKSKSKKYQDAKYDTVLRQLNKLSNLLYPNENLQERELNFIYFVNKFGFNLIDKIYEEISIQEFSHQVIYL
jgi:bacillithiol biosynthesis cysteine-adding enzyme BshC